MITLQLTDPNIGNSANRTNGPKAKTCKRYKLNKSENATIQLSIFYEKVLDKKIFSKA